MARRNPYGNAPAEHMAFVIAQPHRRFLLLHAASHGRVHSRDLIREFPEYDRHSAADVFHVMKKHGFLKPDAIVLDITGLPNQLTYVLTPTARRAIADLHALTGVLHDALLAALSPTPEVSSDEPQPD